MDMNGHAADAAPVPPAIVVECFGVPRVLAGPRLEATGATLGALAADLAARFPVLRGCVIDGDPGWIVNGYTFVVDDRFSRDPGTRVSAGSSVLLVSSAAGG